MICNIQFREGEYKDHIRSDMHAESVKANEHIYSEIDSIINLMNKKLMENKLQKNQDTFKDYEKEMLLNSANCNNRLNDSTIDLEDSCSVAN